MNPEQRVLVLLSAVVIVLAVDLLCVKTANGNIKAHIPENRCHTKQHTTSAQSRSVRANSHSASLGVGCSRSNCT